MPRFYDWEEEEPEKPPTGANWYQPPLPGLGKKWEQERGHPLNPGQFGGPQGPWTNQNRSPEGYPRGHSPYEPPMPIPMRPVIEDGQSLVRPIGRSYLSATREMTGGLSAFVNRDILRNMRQNGQN